MFHLSLNKYEAQFFTNAETLDIHVGVLLRLWNAIIKSFMYLGINKICQN